MSRPVILACAVVALLSILTSVSIFAEDWSQFRGPNASGVSTESDDLPVEFSIDDKVLWSAEVGEGIACPIIVDNRAHPGGHWNDAYYCTPDKGSNRSSPAF